MLWVLALYALEKIHVTKTNNMARISYKESFTILGATLIALVAPLLLMAIVYPIGQLFLPQGNIVLTFTIRVICTTVVTIIDYALTYRIMKVSTIQRGILFNIVCFLLIFVEYLYWYTLVYYYIIGYFLYENREHNILLYWRKYVFTSALFATGDSP